ncbi:MAG: PilZ domain-containing protein [Chlamydiota bacterium]
MRRHFPRYAADMPMVATVIGDRDVRALQGRCKVVSEGGLGAVLPGRIPLGDVVSLELHFPNSEQTVYVRAAVRHSRYPRYGLEFVALGESQRKVIARYCEIHSRPARALLIDAIRKYFLAREY